MIVMKFGGASLANPEMYEKAVEIILAEPREKIVVVSAPAGLTDHLISLTKKTVTHFELNNNLELLNLHARLDSFMVNFSLDLNGCFDYLIELLKRGFILKGLSKDLSDEIISLGEIISVQIMRAALSLATEKPIKLLPYQLIQTDSCFWETNVNFPKTDKKIRSYFENEKNSKTIYLIPGFLGITEENKTITLGRGGSDYSATILGAALEVEEIQLWKTEDGLFTADPKIVPKAKLLPRISYEEACEITYWGAKIIHPRAVLPAAQKKIPIRLKNTLNPSLAGTLIAKIDIPDNIYPVKFVIGVKDCSLIKISGKGMQGVKGILARASQAVKKAGINIMMVSQASAEQGITFVAKTTAQQLSVQKLKEEFAPEIKRDEIESINAEKNQAILSIVGDGMIGQPGICAKFFTALGKKNINIKSIAQGAEERNISVVIEEKNLERAIRAVHSVFGLDIKKNCF